MHCPNCKKKIRTGMNRCTRCGLEQNGDTWMWIVLVQVSSGGGITLESLGDIPAPKTAEAAAELFRVAAQVGFRHQDEIQKALEEEFEEAAHVDWEALEE